MFSAHHKVIIAGQTVVMLWIERPIEVILSGYRTALFNHC